jgi:glycerol-3-phosphate acyltransferase PlsX
MGLNTNGARPTIAVDAMGGDHAPDQVVRGALQAAEGGAKVVLVGPEEVLQLHLKEHGRDLPILDARDVVEMDEPVGQAMRRRDSSLRQALNLVASGEAAGAVSAGNSAAIMALSVTMLGRQPGVDRPAFGGTLPNRHGGVFVLDIGANSTVKPNNLLQFAVMGDVFVRTSRGIESPRIALLSNGSEDSKGTKEIKEANEALHRLDINFIGNVEGNQIFEGLADVVVCDGFSGNVLLKASEGVAAEILSLLKREIEKDLLARVASTALIPTFQRIKRQVDFEEYGGVPVLGVNGVMINCHGRSRAKAVTNAILLAERLAKEHLLERIGESLHEEALEAGRRRRLARALHLRPSHP